MLNADAIFSSTNLPSPPMVAIQLLEHTRNPDSTIVDFVNTIKTDPAMAVKILKAANSSYFSFRSQVTSLDRAVALIGLKSVAMMVLGFSLVNESKVDARVADFYQAYWLQTVVQAITAETVARRLHPGQEAEIFLAGLMLDIGRLAMLKAIPDQYAQTLVSFNHRIQESKELRLDLAEHEQEELGFSHVEVGMRLIDSWGLPRKLIEVIGAHHIKLEALESQQLESQAAVLHAGMMAAAAGDWFWSENKGNAWERLQKIGKICYGIDDQELEDLLSEARERIEAGAQMFSANVKAIPSSDDLLSQAKEQLTDLAIKTQMESLQVVQQKNQIEAEHRLLTEKTRQLETEVIQDRLTCAFSRKFFDDALEKEISRCGRNGLGAAVVFCDIDDFKFVNDTYGHACGDEILKQVAVAMSQSIRKSDILARYGGEELVILLIDISPDVVNEINEKVRKSVEELSVEWEGIQLSVTISIGCCVAFQVNANREVGISRTMLEKADEAMYVAKRAGKNAVHYCDISDESDGKPQLPTMTTPLSTEQPLSQ